MVGYRPMQHDVGCGTHEAIYKHCQRDGRADGCTLDPDFVKSMRVWEGSWDDDGDEDTYGWSWEEEDEMVATEGMWDTDVADTCWD